MGKSFQVFSFLIRQDQCSAVSPCFTGAAGHFSCQKNLAKTNWSWVWTCRPSPFFLVEICQHSPFFTQQVLDSVTCGIFITAKTNSSTERGFLVGDFRANPSFLDLYMFSSLFPFLSLFSCYRMSARKVMEQGKMAESRECHFTLFLELQNENALLRACCSAADVSCRSLILSV